MRGFPRLRFSLRTLLLVTVVVAILAGEYTRRLWRFQERNAAIATLASYGFRFTVKPSRIKLEEADPRAKPPFDRLDAWLFGDEVHKRYYHVEFRTFDHAAASVEQPNPDFDKLLQHLPELETLQINPGDAFNIIDGTKQYWRAKGIDTMRLFLAAVVSHPHLIMLDLDSLPSEVGTTWLVKIPLKNRLEMLIWRSELPSETISSVLEHIPSIDYLNIWLLDLNEDLIRRFSQCSQWQYDQDGKSTGTLFVDIKVTPDSIHHMERMLNQVQFRLQLEIFASRDTFTERTLRLDGSGLRALTCFGFKRVELENLKRCESLYVHFGLEKLIIKNCPQLSSDREQVFDEGIIRLP